MKTLLVTFSFLFLLTSCTNDNTSIPEQTTSEIAGSWSLVSVSGGFAPTINLDPSWITYHFGQNLTVINYSPITTAQSLGLEMGSYSYTFNSNVGTCENPNYYQLSISGFLAASCIQIENSEMTIDFGSALDGFLYKFVRKECGTPEPCFTQSQSEVESVILPITGNINQPITLQIAFIVTNGCGGLGYIAENNSENEKTLKVFAKYPCDSICTQALVTLYTNYTFTPTTAGNQILKIQQPDGSFLTYQITIQ